MLQEVFFKLLILLIFALPGYCFLWSYGYTAKNDFMHVLYSIFWGTILMVVFFYTFPVGEISPILRSPYVGAVLVSFFAFALGWVVKKAEPSFRKWWLSHKHY